MNNKLTKEGKEYLEQLLLECPIPTLIEGKWTKTYKRQPLNRIINQKVSPNKSDY